MEAVQGYPRLHSLQLFEFEASLGCKQNISDGNMIATELPQEEVYAFWSPHMHYICYLSNHRNETAGKQEASCPCQLPAHMEESQSWDSVERQDFFLAESF